MHTILLALTAAAAEPLVLVPLDATICAGQSCTTGAGDGLTWMVLVAQAAEETGLQVEIQESGPGSRCNPSSSAPCPPGSYTGALLTVHVRPSEVVPVAGQEIEQVYSSTAFTVFEPPFYDTRPCLLYTSPSPRD